MNAKPYPKYKASGVEWLGDVPGHWEVKRSDGLISTAKSQIAPEAFKDQEVFHYSIPVIQETGTGAVENGEDIASAKQVISSTTLLISKLNPRKATICVAHPQEQLTLASTELVALTADKCELKFLEYLALSELFRQGLDSKVQSVTRSHQRANPQEIYRFWFAWPPTSEQQSIADFLDDRTAKLDALLEKKRALIGKLNEKRSALISRTVTKGLPPEAAAQAGLNPKPKFKSSGISWLGDIPEHWEAMTVRRKARRIQTGGTPPTSEERYYEDGSVPWYGPSSFGDEIAVSQPVKFLNSSAVSDRAARVFKGGATMIVTIGATLGKIASLEEAGSCNQQITVIEFDERKVYPQFGTFQLKRLELSLRAIAPSATLPILDQGEIGDIPFAMPPIAEQKAIVDFLHAELSMIDRMIQKVETAIEKLTEYRTALITAAVTGKIDVRRFGS